MRLTITQRPHMFTSFNSLVRFLPRTLILGALFMLAAHAALAQTRPLKLLVAFPPGGPVDFVARTLSEQLGKELNQAVLVENKAGANGAIAAEALLKAPADGHTLWLTSVGAVAINPALYPGLPYRPLTDLAPVSMVVNNVEMLVVNPASPANQPAEFLNHAKNKRLSMASSGTGSVPHLAMELLSSATQIEMVHVPYKGAAPAITDVIAGHVDGFFGDIPGLIGHIKAGKLKPVAIAATQRHPLFPTVKTFEEIGVKGVDSDNWYALFAHKGTSPADLQRLNKAVVKTLADPNVMSRLSASGAVPASSSPEELAAVLVKDSSKWAQIIKTKNIKDN